MLNDDDARARPQARHDVGADLSAISIAELRERVAYLKAEIDRLETEIERKEASRRAAADAFRL